MPLDRNAEEARTALVLADRQQGAAERRAQQQAHQADGDGEDDQDEVVEQDGVVLDVDRATGRCRADGAEKPRSPS